MSGGPRRTARRTEGLLRRAARRGMGVAAGVAKCAALRRMLPAAVVAASAAQRVLLAARLRLRHRRTERGCGEQCNAGRRHQKSVANESEHGLLLETEPEHARNQAGSGSMLGNKGTIRSASCDGLAAHHVKGAEKIIRGWERRQREFRADQTSRCNYGADRRQEHRWAVHRRQVDVVRTRHRHAGGFNTAAALVILARTRQRSGSDGGRR